MRDKIDFAIITAIDIERRAVCEAFHLTDDDRVFIETRVYWRKPLELKQGEFYQVVVVQSPDMANVDAALLASDVIHHWQPGAILLVGIAVGVDPDQQQLGDLVIGRDIYYYERGKQTADGKFPEPVMYRADATLLNRVQAVPKWIPPKALLTPDGRENPLQIHCGVIASGEKVIAHSVVRDNITSGHRKIAAVETEGYGFSAGAWQSFERVRHLVIKAICNFADASKRDNWESYAAAVAAEFTKHFLLDRPLQPRNPPHVVLPPDLDQHYKLVTQAFIHGRVIPFLGEGINLLDQPPNQNNKEGWRPGQQPPSDSELAGYLVRQFGSPFATTEIRCPITCKAELPDQCPVKGKLGPDEVFTCPLFENQRLVAERKDLQALSQYVDLIFGSLGLYEELHQIFAREYCPNQLHEFFAHLPRQMQDKGFPLPFPLIVTTNYDDTLERAFEKAGQPYDLVSYIAKGENQGKFIHHPYVGEVKVIDCPNEYGKFNLEKIPVILKLYGAVNRSQEEGDNFVITEDHYMDYLTRQNQMPKCILKKLLRSHILFLGYDLDNWKLRLILRRIWGNEPLDRLKSWVVCLNPGKLTQQLWNERQVSVFERSLGSYITELSHQIDLLAAKETSNGQ